MGKGWKNPIKAANAAKKGMEFSKLAKEIQVAAKLGGADPDMNSRLRLAVDAAKAKSCPKDTIEKAIKKGAGLLEGEAQPEEVLYEGFGPAQVGILVECQTDNRARTATDIKVAFNKNNGRLAEAGSIAWMFERVGLLEGFNTNRELDIEEEAIEAGASDVEPSEIEAGLGASFYTAPEELDIVRKALIERGWTIEVMELSYRAKNNTDINDEDKALLSELLEKLDDNEDSFRVYSTVEF
jgi:YebC/PmpR family DNA-binding regulatory protein